jgi:hypothetical protein
MTIRTLLNKSKLYAATRSTKKFKRKFKTQRARKMKKRKTRTSRIKWKISNSQAATTKTNIEVTIPYRSITRNHPIIIITNIEVEVDLKAPKIKKP